MLRALKTAAYAEPKPFPRIIAAHVATFALIAVGVLLVAPHWGSDAGLSLLGLATLSYAYTFWPERISLLRLGKELGKAILLIVGLMGITVFLFGLGRLMDWDVVTALGEALADLLTAGG